MPVVYRRARAYCSEGLQESIQLSKRRESTTCFSRVRRTSDWSVAFLYLAYKEVSREFHLSPPPCGVENGTVPTCGSRTVSIQTISPLLIPWDTVASSLYSGAVARLVPDGGGETAEFAPIGACGTSGNSNLLITPPKGGKVRSAHCGAGGAGLVLVSSSRGGMVDSAHCGACGAGPVLVSSSRHERVDSAHCGACGAGSAPGVGGGLTDCSTLIL